MASSSLFLNHFTVLDFAFLAAEEGFQGESLHVSVELQGQLDSQGFILDFGVAKKILKALVDESLDHKLVVPNHPELKGTAKGFQFRGFQYHAPEEAVVVLESETVTIQDLESYLNLLAREKLPKNVEAVSFRLEQEARFFQEPNFRYTHGLRLHEGNCQRLIHGHRNPIEVWLGENRLTQWEEFLALEWAGAHFAFAPTLRNASLDLPLDRRVEKHQGRAEIGYESPQGEFWAEIPASRVILLDQEPSIENIARLGVRRLKDSGAPKGIRVVAYEGINKGASFSDL